MKILIIIQIIIKNTKIPLAARVLWVVLGAW